MKTVRFTILTLLFIATCFLPPAFSSERWGLPPGAKMRLGKGIVYENIIFSRYTSLLAVPSSIGVWLYDARTGKERNLLTNHTGYVSSVDFSPDGKTLASSSGSEFYIWDVATGERKIVVAAHSNEISDVAFSPDGKILATAGDYEGPTVKLWDVATGALKTTFRGHTDDIRSIAFSPDGKTLASGGYDEENTIELWDVATEELKATLTTKDEFGLRGVRNIAFSPDGKTLAACEGWWGKQLFLWDVATGTPKAPLIGHMGGTTSVDFSPDSRTLASSSMDGTVCLWDVATGSYKTALIAHTDAIASVAFSPDGTTLATASWDSTIILWDTESLQQKITITGHTSGFSDIAFSPTGQTIVSAGQDKTLRLWDTTTGKNTRTLRGHPTPVGSVDFSSDGHTIASSGTLISGTGWFAVDHTVRLWDAASGKHKATLFGDKTSGGNVTFSPDGRILAKSTRKVIFWDVATGNLIWTIPEDERRQGYLTVTFSPDWQKLAIGIDSEIRLWDIESRQAIATFHAPAYRSRISNIAFSPDGNTIAIVWKNRELYLWSINSSDRKIIPIEQTSYYIELAFSPDGQTLITAGRDGTVQIWDAISGESKSTLMGMPNGIDSLVFSPDGKTFATSSWDGTILLWDFPFIVNPGQMPPEQLIPLEADVNRDGVEDVYDLVIVAANFGQTGPNPADVNGDGVVNIADLIQVAAALADAAAAPSVYQKVPPTLTAKALQQWLAQAQQLPLTEPTEQRGIHFLQQLFAILTPKKTVLLPNYPNPFNPETWIPYQLANAAEVTLRIHSATGHLVRVLKLGHQPAGIYQNQNRAAYWDGKNERGEPVASGVYFYTLSADDVTATRRMVIRK